MVRKALVGAVLSLCVVTATMALSACTPPPKRILVIGDSLTVGSVTAGLGDADRHTWVVSAETGRSTNTGITIASQRKIADYDLVVIALGTNDYLDTKATYRTRIEKMMKVLGSRTPVLWIDVDAQTDHLSPAARGVNPALAEADAAHANLRVGRWDAYVRSVSMTGRRARDEIHYTASGYDLRARWLEGLVG